MDHDPTPALDLVPRRKLADEVTERLLHRIRTGGFPEGERLPSERQLMAMFGVGRPTIRESLQNLERMGLITITHGERASVLPVSARTVIGQVGAITRHLLSTSPQTLEHLKDARLLFEVTMVRIAAQRASAHDIAAIRQALAEHRHALADLSVFLDRDMAFHRAIAAVSRNPIFPALSEAMFGWLASYHTELVRASGAERLTLEEHGAILDAIERHDPDAAAQAMTAHLTRANALYSLIGLGFPRDRSGAAAERSSGESTRSAATAGKRTKSVGGARAAIGAKRARGDAGEAAVRRRNKPS